jgi:release factor glutamine methyltransferase
MKLREAEQYAKDRLIQVYGEQEAVNITGWLLEDLTGYSRTERIAGREGSFGYASELDEYLERLLKHEPVQYVLQKAWFQGMQLYVDKNVLIPRPETEELVEWIVNDVKAMGLDVFERGPAQADKTSSLKVLDACTGSGCIALALKKRMPKAEVWGCDESDSALNVARRNGSQLDIRVDFQGMDFLDEAQQKLLPSVDILACNPPYIPLRDKASMNPNVVEHEPHMALFVTDNDALIFYKAIIDYSGHRLHEGGRIYMEIHEDLGKEVTDLFAAAGFQTELRKDMQGKDRMIKAFNR